MPVRRFVFGDGRSAINTGLLKAEIFRGEATTAGQVTTGSAAPAMPVLSRDFLPQEREPRAGGLDKSEGFVKGKVVLGSAEPPGKERTVRAPGRKQ